MWDSILKHANPFERHALALLRSPESYPGLEPIGEQPLLRIFRLEGVGNYASWAVFPGKNGFEVRRVTWDRRRDVGMIEPQTFATTVVIGQNAIASLLSNFPNDPAPADRDRIGVDGTLFIVEFPARSLRYSWWTCGGDRDSLARWVDGAIEMFDEETSNRTHN